MCSNSFENYLKTGLKKLYRLKNIYIAFLYKIYLISKELIVYIVLIIKLKSKIYTKFILDFLYK